jgi:hypothetical protein
VPCRKPEPRFAHLFLDVAAVRALWLAAFGYSPDRRAGVSDIHDPRRLNPVLVFQELDAAETERRRRASPRSSPPVAGSSTSRRIAGGSPTPKATKW